MRFNSKTIKQANELAANLLKHGYTFETLPHETTLCRLVKLANSHCRLMEAACNGELTRWQSSRVKTIENLIYTLTKNLGLTVTFSGDPRGYTVKLHSNSPGFYNTWGGQEAGYGI